MDSLESLLKGILYNNYERAEKVGVTKVGRYTIDTCYTVDCGWETAIWKDTNPMVIVARYATKAEAITGHEDWVAVCRICPVKVWSVQADRYIEL